MIVFIDDATGALLGLRMAHSECARGAPAFRHGALDRSASTTILFSTNYYVM
jgi:hypothetical protein